jgi:hypothetical protein
MKKLIVLILAVPLFLLASCSNEKVLPAPSELYSMIESEIGQLDMIDLAEEMLEITTGISPDQYTSAVYCLSLMGNSPEEIIIIAATDAENAKDIEATLTSRFEQKAEAVKSYLTEYQSLVNSTVVRRDGLTVSLICSYKVDEIIKVYESIK